MSNFTGPYTFVIIPILDENLHTMEPLTICISHRCANLLSSIGHSTQTRLLNLSFKLTTLSMAELLDLKVVSVVKGSSPKN